MTPHPSESCDVWSLEAGALSRGIRAQTVDKYAPIGDVGLVVRPVYESFVDELRQAYRWQADVEPASSDPLYADSGLWSLQWAYPED